MKFECTSCNYKTERKEKPTRCPYCGKPGAMVAAKGAQDFLNDANTGE